MGRKDAKKLLNQALKRQRNSNVKAGIGYVEPDLKKRSERELELKDIIDRNRSAMKLDSLEKPLQLGELNLLLKQENEKRRGVEALDRNARTKFGGMFVAAETMHDEPAQQKVTVTFAKGTQPRKHPEI